MIGDVRRISPNFSLTQMTADYWCLRCRGRRVADLHPRSARSMAQLLISGRDRIARAPNRDLTIPMIFSWGLRYDHKTKIVEIFQSKNTLFASATLASFELWELAALIGGLDALSQELEH
jgi:hypothetical protein